MPVGTIHITPIGGGSSVNLGGSTAQPATALYTHIRQVVGMVPLIPCDEADCRTTEQNQCNMNPVFGNIVDGDPIMEPTYENDWNSFLIDYPVPAGTTNISVIWTLEKAENFNFYTPGSDNKWSWDLVTVLDATNSNGLRYTMGDIPNHPSYDGYAINWAQVLQNYGVGFYRIKATILSETNQITFSGLGVPIITVIHIITDCSVSEPFQLFAWDCNLADGTVKFESWITGNIGDEENQYGIFDLCNIDWYDSIRVAGFLGYKAFANYEEVVNEYDTGYLDQIHEKTKKTYTFNSKYIPLWFHSRFGTYGLMADLLLASDYNFSNSDYYIKRKAIKRDGNYVPKYLDDKRFDSGMRYRQRTAKVTVNFREKVESIIKNVCCVPKC